MSKRFVSILCMFTMLVGVFFSGSNRSFVKAVEEDNTVASVELVGATILAETKSSQSLRFLLKVNNYDKILVEQGQDFGFVLSIDGGKEVKVSYKTAKEIYAINEEEKTLEYAVEINNIYFDNMETVVTAKGFLADEQNDKDESTTPMSRSVKQIADASGYTLTEGSDNKIITKKEITGTDIDLTGQVVPIGGKIDSNQALRSLSSSGEVEGVIVPLNKKYQCGDVCKVTVYGSSDKSSFRVWLTNTAAQDPHCSDVLTDLEFGKTFTVNVTGENGASHIVIKAPQYEKFAQLAINKVVVEKCPMVEKEYNVDLDDSTKIISDNAQLEFKDGTVVATMGFPKGFIVPADDLYEQVEITYTGVGTPKVYLFNEEYNEDGSQGKGQTCSGQVDIGDDYKLQPCTSDKTITISKDVHSDLQKGIHALKIVDLSGGGEITVKSIKFVTYFPNVDVDLLDSINLSDAVYSNEAGDGYGGGADVGDITLTSAQQRILFNLPGGSNGSGNYFIDDEEFAVYVKGSYTGTKGFSVATTSGFGVKSQGDRLTFSAEHEQGDFEHIFVGTATGACGGLAIMAADGQDGVDGLSISEIKVGPLNPSNEGVEDENGIITVVPRNYATKRQDVTYSTMQSDKYYSKYTDSERPFNIILPPGYSEEKKYPVIYMLHGIFCNQDSFGTGTDSNPCPIVQIAGNLYAQKQAEEAIIVIPSIRVCADPDLSDSFSQENYKCYDLCREDILEYLMPYVESHYSVKTGRENTAIAGFSMGGREALYIGVTKTEKFAYVAGFCPTYGIFAYEPNWSGVGEDGLFKKEEDFTLSDEYRNNTLMMIVKGSVDATVGDMPKIYHQALEKNQVPHYYYVVEGGDHNEVSWGHGLYNYMRKVFR